MGKYSCEKCGKSFSQKSHYDKHLTRKNPCEIQTDKIKALIDKAVEEKIIELNTKLKTKLISNNTENNIIINTTKQMDISKMSKLELLEKCKDLGIIKCSSKNKSQLIELINEKNKVVEEPKIILSNEEIPPQNMQINEVDTKTLNVIDLFCGCGGMSKGLTDAGLNVIAGIDIWDKAVESYNKNNNHKAFCEDLTQLPPEKFNELYNKENKIVDILVGGPPCQSFSIAGKRDKNDPRNALFMEYVKYLDYFKPKAFIMENVIGMLSKKTESGENVIDIIMEQLNKNYNCIINKLYASDFEVPQNRRRTIIIGIRKDLNIIPKEPELIIKSKDDRIAVKTILLDKKDVDKSYYLSERAIQGIINKKARSKERGAGFGAQFLNMNKPSYTIPARYWKDGYDALFQYNEKEIRRLTILELKRIQSFPDDYYLEGNKKDQIMQIGNAVACKFAYYLGKHVINTLQ
uniref:DNA (cytosine-5-)-methyltransferase n=1 Tax=viral metagenome TaxID=1070528 RepID=A0A6C0BSG6_9ZZZZ